MKFKNEADFESHLRDIIAAKVFGRVKNLAVLKYKTVADIIICRNGPSPAIFFIEVKYFQLSKGRLGFGNNIGDGIQPEMLTRKPEYLEANVRWLLGSDAHGDGYWLVTSDQLRRYVAGGSIGKKQNNIQEALFREVNGLSEQELAKELVSWLSLT